MIRVKFFSFLLFAITMIGIRSAGAQIVDRLRDAEPHAAFQLSFFTPLGTNGMRAPQYTNDVSVNLLLGVSRNERAFAVAGLANIVKEDVMGVQLAGLVNAAGGEGMGLQWAGLVNAVGGDYMGVQWGGLGSLVGGDYTGWQMGGLMSKAGDFTGAQYSGLVGIARDMKGYQLGGLVNVARDFHGLQVAGLVNVAGDVHGMQLGGLVNVAKRVHGVQFAGLVNVAEKSDYPIGLVNVIKEGEMGVGVSYNEIGTVSVLFRSGGRVTYGILGLGYNTKAPRGKEAWSVTGGYGAHINIAPWFRINNEITVESLGDMFSDDADVIVSLDRDSHSDRGRDGRDGRDDWDDDQYTFKAGYALLPAFRLGDHFEVFGGPSINYMQSTNEGMFDLFPGNSLWKEDKPWRGTRERQQLFIGWQVGAQVLF